ncbi:acyl-CoA Delta(11) desaturase-like [Bombyx mandarina]|uniref:Acyl-CoA Delta(11) desaturase-like n=1 Tax=Bombyx mandarina TaxID=7092 RepID=A0A6J2JW09_BOMMA|nr:acyl-CoA Delta(11) desaturase-like [Bombyx mandarina]
MAPLNIVDTPYSDLTKLEDSIENKPNNQANKPNNFEKTNTVDPYDEVKLNEPIFLAPIRKWERSMGFVTPIRWTNAILITTFHVVTVVWGFYTIFYEKQKPMWQSVIFGIFMGQLAGFGVTAGAHRYWCHRSYKAKLPLQLILALCYSAAGQNTIYEWVRDHRVHHKFSETSADPHDANRGFFFSHIGWLMMKKHPDVVKQGSKIDMSDIIHDPVVIFCTKYFILFKITFCWVIPSALPVYAWGELWNIAILSQAFWRYMLSLHFTWSVNSFAHLWGNKPYDRYIMPCENKGVSIVAMGEGWHNYHHTFPWDYKAAELGVPNNTTTFLLDLFARIGWAYDLKQASPALVRAVAKQRGECKE